MNGGYIIPDSVINPEIFSQGVMSVVIFDTEMALGEISESLKFITSSLFRSSIGKELPSSDSISIIDVGAAT